MQHKASLLAQESLHKTQNELTCTKLVIACLREWLIALFGLSCSGRQVVY